MTASINATRHAVFRTAYHFVWIQKYRKKILCGSVASELKKILEQVCADKGFVLIALEIQPDHVHTFLSAPPKAAPSEIAKLLKGISSRLIFSRFLGLKKILWKGHLWAPSYYVGTAGEVSAETIKKYIERTEHLSSRA